MVNGCVDIFITRRMGLTPAKATAARLASRATVIASFLLLRQSAELFTSHAALKEPQGTSLLTPQAWWRCWMRRRSEAQSTNRSMYSRYFQARSEEHTSELQSQSNLVCRLLLEKQKNITGPTDRVHPSRLMRPPVSPVRLRVRESPPHVTSPVYATAATNSRHPQRRATQLCSPT